MAIILMRCMQLEQHLLNWKPTKNLGDKLGQKRGLTKTINFSELYHEKLCNKNLLFSMSPEGPP